MDELESLSMGPAGMFARRRWFAPVLLSAAAVCVYASSFAGSFVFDDVQQIVRNRALLEIWPGLWTFLTRQRTLTTLTFALDRALYGIDPRGYHVLNVGVHLAAALTLLGILRRTLQLARFEGRFRNSGDEIAFAVALLWLVHPLQTGSVTYIVQRAEELMGLFYLLTLYCTIRAATSEHSRRWQALAVFACGLGMASKPVMVTAPVVVLLFDRVLVACSWRELVRQRAPLYVALAFSWLVLTATGLLHMITDTEPGATSTIGFGMADATARDYLLTEPQVVLHYLRLALWPDTLVIDYGWEWVKSAFAALLPALALAIPLAWSFVSVARGRAVGLLGLWFFAVLAPTSSVVPVRDAAFEHRMYLPLAAVVCGAVLTGHALLARLPHAIGRRVASGLVVAVALVLGARTVARNYDYHDPIVLWCKAVRDAPGNGRAYTSLATALDQAGRIDEALAVLRDGVQRMESQTSSASRVYSAAAQNSWGNLLYRCGRASEALAHYEQAERTWPLAETHVNWGAALRSLGQYQAALDQYQAALELAPDSAEACNNLAWLLATCPQANLRNGPRAVELAQAAARSADYADASFLDTLAAACAEAQDFKSAREWQQKALELAPAAAKESYAAHLELYRQARPLRDGPGA